MPVVRLSRRRRSSHAIFTPAKPGIYGIPRPVTFAPNVTPITFVDTEGRSATSTPEPFSASSLFPPSATPAPPPTRRRVPPGKRRSLGYIPRPPNAFMLFRADFVRQKHVPGSIETNHGSLSKIIGNIWRALPLEEKKVWEVRAKQAKAEHKARYPEYRFRPVHNKNKDKKKEKASTLEDEIRCEEVAQLLLEGKKGDELAAAVRNLDSMRSATPVVHHRRSSSVPLPNDHYFGNITIPSIPFFGYHSRPMSPVNSISRQQQQRMMLGHRRSSSAQPTFNRSWTMPFPSSIQHDHSPLPDVDMSLFDPAYLTAPSFPVQSQPPYNVSDLLTSLPPHLQSHHVHENTLGPLDNISPHDILAQNLFTTSAQATLPDNTLSWLSNDISAAHHPTQAPASANTSHPSTAYSGSPATSEGSLPVVHAPIAYHADQTPTAAVFNDFFQGFEGFGNGQMADAGLQLDFTQQEEVACGGGTFNDLFDVPAYTQHSAFNEFGYDFGNMVTQ